MRLSVNEIIENLAENNIGGLVVGSRLSGKSYLAEQLAIRFGSRSRLLKLRDWLPLGGDQKISSDERANSYLVNTLKQYLGLESGIVWIIDDAHIFLTSLSIESIRALATAVNSGQIELILVRNYFVNEGNGWFADQERRLLQLIKLNRFEIIPQAEARNEAARFLPTASPSAHEWLMRWSGGLIGLMPELAAFAEVGATRSDADPSSDLQRYVDKTISEYNLNSEPNSTVIRATLDGILLPRNCYCAKFDSKIGYLFALGMLSHDWQSSDRFQGMFWKTVANKAAAAVQCSSPAAKPQFDFLKLEDLFRRTETYAHDFAEYMGIPDENGKLAFFFEYLTNCNQQAPNMVKSLSNLIIEHFGKIGIQMLLLSCEIEPNCDRSSKELIDDLFDAIICV